MEILSKEAPPIPTHQCERTPTMKSASRNPKGRLIIIGGREERSPDRDRSIAETVAAAAAKSRLVIVTVATNLPEELWHDYRKLYKDLGVRDIELLDIRTREQAYSQQSVRK